MKEQTLSTQKRQSSLWSELPPEIIHHIFSFLPTTRQVAKTCLISKCWLHAWRSYFEGPSLIFIVGGDGCFAYKKIEQFHEFVDQTMSRFDNRRSSCNMQKFVFGIPAFANYDFVNKWISIATDNHVQEMDLSKNGYSPFGIPDLKRVLNNGSLRSLSLKLWTTSPITNSINLPNVVTLTLSMQVLINGELLERFLKGCPLLETVTIIGSCEDRASEIKLTGHDRLKTVCLSVEDPKLVHIDVPNLETLQCNTIETGVSIVLSIDKCTKLKHLDLEFFTLDTEWFEGLLSQLASLESLKLKFENYLLSKKELLSISNPSIKKFVLDQCISPSRHSVVIVDPPHDCVVHFRFTLDGSRNWVSKLRKTISRFSNLRSLSLVYRRKVEIGGWWEDGNLTSTRVEIGLLKVRIDDEIYSQFFTKLNKLLSGLFSICRPAIITIEASGKNAHNKEISRKNLKLLAENFLILDRDKEVVKCQICSNGRECWKHQLREVKIVKEDEEESAAKISFMLKW